MKKTILLFITLSVGIPIPTLGMQKLSNKTFGKIKQAKLDKSLKNFPKTASEISLTTLNKKILSPNRPFFTKIDISATTNFKSSESQSLLNTFKKWISTKLWNQTTRDWLTIENFKWGKIIETIPENIRAIIIPESSVLSKNSEKSQPHTFQKGIRVRIPKNSFSSFARGFFVNTKKMFEKNSLRIVTSRSLHTERSVDQKLLSFRDEIASKMSAKEFVRLLHNNNLTVADSIRLDVTRNNEASWEMIFKKTNLSDVEKEQLQSFLNLKNVWRKKNSGSGGYDSKNIVFEEEFHSYIVQMIKNTFREADIPFKVVIKTDEEESLASVSFIPTSKTRIKFDNLTNKATDINVDGVLNLCLNKKLFGKNFGGNYNVPCCSACRERTVSSCLVAQAMIAHETMHILKLHSLELGLLDFYFNKSKLKNIGEVDFKKCNEIFTRLCEYQADILPLTNSMYAEAQQHFYMDHQNQKRDFVYIPAKEMYELASRAVELHEAEQAFITQSVHSK